MNLPTTMGHLLRKWFERTGPDPAYQRRFIEKFSLELS